MKQKNSDLRQLGIYKYILLASCMIVCFMHDGFAGDPKVRLSFTVSMPEPASGLYQVEFRCEGIKKDTIVFKMPAWTPGYYQMMNYADYVQDFKASAKTGKELKWEKNANSWKVNTGKESTVLISYAVKGTRPFVATNFLDKERGYISPAGLFMHPDGLIRQPVTVTIEPYPGWVIATGLDSIKGKHNSFLAPDYDVLYDSPVLAGDLELFPPFTVKGVPHYFAAYKAGDFDKAAFMSDLKKIVETASGIIGDIPYKHYTFLAIGPGGGGIEHLNSASVAFSGAGLKTKEGMIRMYNFLAHEYFHHYNVKRIRPIELGPFDYDNGSRTKMLWLSEGITVYYEYLIVKRAGFISGDELLKTFQQSIKAYESKPGRYFQTPAEASWDTWSDGPFGRTGDDINKTISPYDKGPALGILLDFKIRHETGNKKSLDDLMRLLYEKYYKGLKRGFTEKEFRDESEKMAGTALADFFDYIYTLKPVDYPAYFNYAGLAIDTVSHELPGAFLGVTLRKQNDTVFIANTEWQSPAWNAGLRNRNTVLSINGNKPDPESLHALLLSSHEGDAITLSFSDGKEEFEKKIILGKKKEPGYSIALIPDPGPLQEAILKSWLGERKD